ncbi:MAG: hypothetical protein ABEI96_06750 [Haloarculaceae archaeon]
MGDMLRRLTEFLGFSPPTNRPFGDLSDEELLERYVRTRIELRDDDHARPTAELVGTADKFMEEWEWRHGGLEEFDARADRLEAELRDDE